MTRRSFPTIYAINPFGLCGTTFNRKKYNKKISQTGDFKNKFIYLVYLNNQYILQGNSRVHSFFLRALFQQNGNARVHK